MSFIAYTKQVELSSSFTNIVQTMLENKPIFHYIWSQISQIEMKILQKTLSFLRAETENVNDNILV